MYIYNIYIYIYIYKCNLKRNRNYLGQKEIDSQIFFIWVFFNEHSRFTGEQGKWEDNSLTPLYDFSTRFTET